jgi:hypothetical protein
VNGYKLEIVPSKIDEKMEDGVLKLEPTKVNGKVEKHNDVSLQIHICFRFVHLS